MLKVLKDEEKLKISMAMIPNGCDLISLILKEVSYENLKRINSMNFQDHSLANGLDKVLDAAKELIELGESELELFLLAEN